MIEDCIHLANFQCSESIALLSKLVSIIAKERFAIWRV